MTETILLDHGSGGKLTNKLIEEIFIKHFDNRMLKALTDSALLNIKPGMLAFTTDSYVVKPIFFPGGNIGKLAICGTINDLAVSGAQPLYLSAGFIIEEGFCFKELEEIVSTMAEEARKCHVTVVTGDTKVVEKGACDHIFINTAGIGVIREEYRNISYGTEMQVGDEIIVNGYIAEHGMAVLGKRNELDFEAEIVSDCAGLNGLIARVLNLSSQKSNSAIVHFMRDATRGGIATVLCELAQHKNIGILLDESAIPVRDSVKGLCELLGFDPLYIANEGKVVMIVGEKDADNVLYEMQKDPLGKDSAVIGEIVANHAGTVVLETEVGGRRIVDMLSGAQLPRIC